MDCRTRSLRCSALLGSVPFALPFGFMIRLNQLCKNLLALRGCRSGFASSQESALRYSDGLSTQGNPSPKRESCLSVTEKCWPENESDGGAGVGASFFCFEDGDGDGDRRSGRQSRDMCVTSRFLS